MEMKLPDIRNAPLMTERRSLMILILVFKLITSCVKESKKNTSKPEES